MPKYFRVSPPGQLATVVSYIIHLLLDLEGCIAGVLRAHVYRANTHKSQLSTVQLDLGCELFVIGE